MTWEVRYPPNPVDVVKSWEETYSRHLRDPHYAEHHRKTSALKALVNPTAEQIDAIIGHDGWTTLSCDGGHATPKAVIVIDINGGEFEEIFCSQCVAEMAATLQAAEARTPEKTDG